MIVFDIFFLWQPRVAFMKKATPGCIEHQCKLAAILPEARKNHKSHTCTIRQHAYTICQHATCMYSTPTCRHNMTCQHAGTICQHAICTNHKCVLAVCQHAICSATCIREVLSTARVSTHPPTYHCACVFRSTCQSLKKKWCPSVVDLGGLH